MSRLLRTALTPPLLPPPAFPLYRVVQHSTVQSTVKYNTVQYNTHREGLVIELAPVDRLAAGASSVREVATLDHELQPRHHHPQTPGKMT